MALNHYLCNMIEDLKIYCAQLQGFTDYIWRNTHAEMFGGIDIYYTPFMRMVNGEIPKRDILDILPENNTAPIHPQIIACAPTDAVMMATKMKEMGYHCIDINMGCPHPPIALKKKGSGILAYPDVCKQTLSALAQIPDMEYSIKMRLGYDDAQQWKSILPLFESINPKEIVLHPRIGKQLYKGEINFEQFMEFAQSCRYPLIYNGDIQSIEQIHTIKEKCPNLSGVMIGRKLLATPDLFETEKSAEKIRHFHDLLLELYSEKLTGGEHQILSKMKTLWEYLLPEADKKARKLIKKSNNLTKYNEAVNLIFRNSDFK